LKEKEGSSTLIWDEKNEWWAIDDGWENAQKVLLNAQWFSFAKNHPINQFKIP
jgi:hypothetical protein